MASISLRDGDVLPYRALRRRIPTPEFDEYLASHPRRRPARDRAGRVRACTARSRISRHAGRSGIRDAAMPARSNAASARCSACRCCATTRSGRDRARAPEPGLFTESRSSCPDLRRPGGDRDRERAAVRGGAGTHARTRASLDDLRTAQDRLIQTEKLASLGQLTAGIAHEIKNPLNFVNNFSALSRELIDELQRGAQAGRARPTRCAQEVDELTGMLKAISKRSSSTASAPIPSSRTCCCIPAKAPASAGRPTSTRWSRRASTSPITARAPKSRSFNVTMQRDFDPDAGAGRPLPAGDHPRLPQFDLQRLLRRRPSARRRMAAGFEPIVSASTRNLGDTGGDPHSRQRHRHSRPR